MIAKLGMLLQSGTVQQQHESAGRSAVVSEAALKTVRLNQAQHITGVHRLS